MKLTRRISEVAAKIAGKDSEHRSRFHSRRGELCTSVQLLSFLLLALRRSFGLISNEPWMTPAAVRYLKRALRRDDVVLELGSGSSTAWYASRVQRVVSLENNPTWAERVRAELTAHANAEVRLGPFESLFDTALLETKPSVLIVDHTDQGTFSRADAIRRVSQDGGAPHLLVLDDSDRAAYQGVTDMLKGWRAMRFSGFRTKPLRLSETTVFAKT